LRYIFSCSLLCNIKKILLAAMKTGVGHPN
jgi:hypothetical protein